MIAVGVGGRVIAYRYIPVAGRYRPIWSSQETGRLFFPNIDSHWQPTFGDPDGDGQSEIVSVDHWMLHVWGDHGTAPVSVQISNVPYTHGATAVVDLDGDGRDEILVGRENVLGLWRYGEDAFRLLDKIAMGDDPEELIWNINAADLNGNGTVEIVVGGTLMDGSDQVLKLFRMEGERLVRAGMVTIERSADVTRLFDWDGDGLPEILTGGNGQRVRLIGLDPSGSRFEHLWVSEDLDGFVQGLAAGDLTGDGVPELVAGTYVYPEVHQRPPGLTVFRKGSDGLPVPWLWTETGQVGYPGLVIADLDADGLGELLLNGNRVYQVTGAGEERELVLEARLAEIRPRPGELQPNASIASDFRPTGDETTHPLILIQQLMLRGSPEGRLHPGERTQLIFMAENRGWETSDLTFRLVTDDDRIRLIEDEVHLGFLNAGAVMDNSSLPFILEVLPGARPGPFQIEVVASTVDGHRFSRRFAGFEVVVDPAR